jgi:aryl-alcohol dehydrogenase-like predicted oxidoreductase
MEYRQLGRSGLMVSTLSLGTMTFGGKGKFVKTGDTDLEGARRQVGMALDAGINLFDTADVYSNGASEEILGQALKGKRDAVILATKARFRMGDAPNDAGLSRYHLIRAAEASLKRLGTDRIDLFYQHRVDPDVPIEDVAGTVKELITQGKVRHFGLSEASVRTIRRAHAVTPVTALQSEYSLWWREPETETLPLLDELGIGFVPFSPLGKGFLAGSVTADTPLDSNDWRTMFPRFAPDALSGHLGLVQAVQRIAARFDATPGQIALAWLLAQGRHVVPIPGTRRLQRIEENLGAADIQLTAEDLAELDRVSAENQVQGDRYPEQMQRLIDR